MHPIVATLLLLALVVVATGFQVPSPRWRLAPKFTEVGLASPPPLLAKKKKPKANRGGGGFGASKPSMKDPSVVTISADKTSLEKQWDVFASITDLEIAPKGDPDEEDYQYFEVADVFVRCGATDRNEGTKWFRIGKVCAADGSSIASALTLQKGLIFWTAVHMRRELVAAGGRSGAAALELGYTAASMVMGSESDGPLEEDEADEVRILERVSVQGVLAKSFGFRPDWNPPGFTYKRREKAAMKKKKQSRLDEIAATS